MLKLNTQCPFSFHPHWTSYNLPPTSNCTCLLCSWLIESSQSVVWHTTQSTFTVFLPSEIKMSYPIASSPLLDVYPTQHVTSSNRVLSPRSRSERRGARPPGIVIARAGQLRCPHRHPTLCARGSHGWHPRLVHGDPAEEHPGPPQGGCRQRKATGETN